MTKRLATALLLLLAAALPLTAHAQQSVNGTWDVEKVAGAESPDNASLTLTFTSEGEMTVTYSLDGEPAQTWKYKYTLVGKTLTLEPTNAVGEPNTTEFELRYEDGKLLLLPPKPEPLTEEEEESPEEEDKRTPVWVLVKA